MTKQVIVALTGQTGAGKDTLAAELQAIGYTRLSFGDSLRKEVSDIFGPCLDERYKGYCQYGSFKDAMNVIGRQSALTRPTIRTEAFDRQLVNVNDPVVVTDVRKPIEIDYLSKLSGKLLYFVEILPSRARVHETKRLDNLLSRYNQCLDRYYETGSSTPDVLKPVATLSNDGTPAELLDKLATVLEVCLPYEYKS
jgi:hypothetical protein